MSGDSAQYAMRAMDVAATRPGLRIASAAGALGARAGRGGRPGITHVMRERSGTDMSMQKNRWLPEVL
jgi:hypothetical protein